MKVISFSLWGNNPKYTIGAIHNAILAKIIYPDWTCVFYIGDGVPESIIKGLQDLTNCLIIPMEGQDWTGMFWRFLAAGDEDVEIMISRDCDSRLSFREKEAVQEWIDSDKSFHIMRDHPFHDTQILGGMWGCKKGILKDMQDLILEYPMGDFWQVDQNFLRDIVYPRIKNDCFVHDEFFNYESDHHPFPSKRCNFFVGCAFNADGTPCEPEHLKLVYDSSI